MQQLRWKLRCSPHPTTGDPKFSKNSHSPSLEIPIYLCFAGEFRDDSQHHSRTEREDARGGGTAGSHWLQSFFLLTLKNERIFIFSEFTRLFFRNLTIMNLGISWRFSSDFRQIIRSTKIYSGMVGDLRAGVLCSGLPLHQRPVGAPDRWSQWLRGWPHWFWRCGTFPVIISIDLRGKIFWKPWQLDGFSHGFL